MVRIEMPGGKDPKRFMEMAGRDREVFLGEGQEYEGSDKDKEFYLGGDGIGIKGQFKGCKFIREEEKIRNIGYDGDFVDCWFGTVMKREIVKGTHRESRFPEYLAGVDFRPKILEKKGFKSDFVNLETDKLQIYSITSKKTCACDLYDEALMRESNSNFLTSTVNFMVNGKKMEFLAMSFNIEGYYNYYELGLSPKSWAIEDALRRKIIFIPLNNYLIQGSQNQDGQVDRMFQTCIYMAADPTMEEALFEIEEDHFRISKEVNADRKSGGSEKINFQASDLHLKADQLAFRVIRPLQVNFDELHPKIQEMLNKKSLI